MEDGDVDVMTWDVESMEDVVAVTSVGTTDTACGMTGVVAVAGVDAAVVVVVVVVAGMDVAVTAGIAAAAAILDSGTTVVVVVVAVVMACADVLVMVVVVEFVMSANGSGGVMVEVTEDGFDSSM